VVIHYTASSSAEQALRTLASPQAGVSAHYLIGRDGAIIQLVDERARAWHAGASRWGAMHDLNSASIGIELDNDSSEPYPAVQIDSLLRLLADLRERHRLRPASFLGHSDVAPRRKVDPGPHFPWATLAAHGLGVWCDPPASPAPTGFDALLGLQSIGYDTRDRSAALGAFRLRYRPWAAPDEPIDNDRHLIHCIMARTLGLGDPPLAPIIDAGH
jgi:N-acetylmuramoyl-L-alanine amidase